MAKAITPISAGSTFGKLTALGPQQRKRITVLVPWNLCKCECGKEKWIRRQALLSGHTRSCGCLIPHPRKHGLTKHPLFGVWQGMKQRCENKNSHAYKWYGAKGVVVCASWQEFYNFYSDMGPTWKIGLLLDRKDASGNYEPNNCRWVDAKQSSRNRDYTKKITHNGETKPLTQWADEIGVMDRTLYCRIYVLGWPVERALSEPTKLNGGRFSPSKTGGA